jgi:hypothetical protein
LPCGRGHELCSNLRHLDLGRTRRRQFCDKDTIFFEGLPTQYTMNTAQRGKPSHSELSYCCPGRKPSAGLRMTASRLLVGQPTKRWFIAVVRIPAPAQMMLLAGDELQLDGLNFQTSLLL